MRQAPEMLIDIRKITHTLKAYFNSALTSVNDHMIGVSVMVQPFYCHYHPDSDETFSTFRLRDGYQPSSWREK
jgi:hypothetical protein